MTDAGTFIQEGSNLIRTTVNLIFPSFVGGAASWTLKVTPSTITKTKAFPFSQPRAEIPFDLSKGAQSLYSHDVTSYGEKKTIHIFEGGLKFPPLPGSENATHRLIEAAVFISGWGKRSLVQQPGESAKDYTERSTRFQEAFGSDRYWFAIPSRLGDKSIYIEGSGKNCKLCLSDRDYARLVAEQNHLTGGVWKGPEARQRLSLARWITVVLWVVGLFVLFSYAGNAMAAVSNAVLGTMLFMGPFLLLGVASWALIKFLPKKAIEAL